MAALGISALLVAAGGAGCSDAGDSHACADYACFRSAWLTGNTLVATRTTAVDVHFCFDSDCRDGLIELRGVDDGSACANWEGQASVCFAPSAASGIYEITANWDHQQAKKPPDGSTYTLTLRDHATNAALLDQTSQATYVDGPNLDGCHPDCWSAQISIGHADDAGEGGAPPVTIPSAQGR